MTRASRQAVTWVRGRLKETANRVAFAAPYKAAASRASAAIRLSCAARRTTRAGTVGSRRPEHGRSNDTAACFGRPRGRMTSEPFSEYLNLYYDRALDAARTDAASLTCESLRGKTDDEVARELVADSPLEPPSLAQGEPTTALVDDRVDFARVIIHHTNLIFRPDRLALAYDSSTRENFDGDRYVVSVRREPQKARARYEGQLKTFQENLASLAAQISQGNSNLAGRLYGSSPSAARNAKKRRASEPAYSQLSGAGGLPPRKRGVEESVATPPRTAGLVPTHDVAVEPANAFCKGRGAS